MCCWFGIGKHITFQPVSHIFPSPIHPHSTSNLSFSHTHTHTTTHTHWVQCLLSLPLSYTSYRSVTTVITYSATSMWITASNITKLVSTVIVVCSSFPLISISLTPRAQGHNSTFSDCSTFTAVVFTCSLSFSHIHRHSIFNLYFSSQVHTLPSR